MTLQEYKEELLKVASDIEELVQGLEEEPSNKKEPQREKTAEITKEAEKMDSEIGSLGDYTNKQTAESYILDFALEYQTKH